MEKIVITTEEARSATETVATAPLALPPPKPVIPLALRFATSPLVLTLPLLCLAAIGIRLALLSSTPRIQLAWAQWLSSLLVASGLLTTLLFSIAYFTLSRSGPAPLAMPLMEFRGAFPAVPSVESWNAQRLVRETSPLVFVITPDTPGWTPGKSYTEAGAVGAGVLLAAFDDGFLVATNRHVVEASSWLAPRVNTDSVLLFQQNGGASRGQVIAIHKNLDLALVWTERRGSSDAFRQPIAPFGDVEAGQNVFVIGHPERLFFSISTGIVMRTHEEKMVQVSAPVSPGNSGGPVYDEHGRLLAVVSYKVDRRFNPNAENLNFAVRADALLDPDPWTRKGDGEKILDRFWQNGSQQKDAAAPANSPTAAP